MKEFIITDTVSEKIKAKWDGERFALVKAGRNVLVPPQIIILNPKELLNLSQFIASIGEEISC